MSERTYVSRTPFLHQVPEMGPQVYLGPIKLMIIAILTSDVLLQVDPTSDSCILPRFFPAGVFSIMRTVS